MARLRYFFRLGGALTGTVSVVALNVREAPSTSDPILGKLSSGTIVTLLARNEAGDWWLVCLSLIHISEPTRPY